MLASSLAQSRSHARWTYAYGENCEVANESLGQTAQVSTSPVLTIFLLDARSWLNLPAKLLVCTKAPCRASCCHALQGKANHSIVVNNCAIWIVGSNLTGSLYMASQEVLINHLIPFTP